MAKCTAIELIEKSPTLGDLVRVTIDNTTTALWFYEYSEAMKFLNEEVIVEYRQDIYNGQATQFIKTFVRPQVVTTLSKSENIKLYVDQIDNNSNLSFTEIENGDTRQGAIVLCTHCEFKSSAKSVWQELIIRDRSMHTAPLRVFDYENSKADFSGQYIMVDLSRSKYGFQTDVVIPVDGEIGINPELVIAEKFIRNYFANDSVALDFINKTNLVGQLSEVVDYEKGYGLMRLAMELSLVDSMDNITKDVNLKAIGQAILCSYGHYTRHSILSDSVNNVTLALGYMFPDRGLIAQLLDVALEEKPKEAVILKNIRDTVSAILEVRKGTTF